MNSKALRRNVILGVVLLLAIGLVAGAWMFVRYRRGSDPEANLEEARQLLAQAEQSQGDTRRDLLHEAMKYAGSVLRRDNNHGEANRVMARIDTVRYRDTGQVEIGFDAVLRLELAARAMPQDTALLTQLAELSMQVAEITPQPILYQKLSWAASQLKRFDPGSPAVLYYEAFALMNPAERSIQQAREKIDQAIAAFKERGDTKNPLLFRAYQHKLNGIAQDHYPAVNLSRRWHELKSGIENPEALDTDRARAFVNRERTVTAYLRQLSETPMLAQINSMLVPAATVWHEAHNRLANPRLSQTERAAIAQQRDRRFERELANLLANMSAEPLAVIDEALALKPESVPMLIARARIAADYLDDIATARRILQDTLSALPPHDDQRSEVLSNLAVLARTEGSGHYDDAERHYLDAIAATPANPRPRIELARFYRQQGELDKAIAQLDALLQIDERQAAARLELIEIYYDRRQFDRLIAQADSVIGMQGGGLHTLRARVWKAQALLHRDTHDANAALAEMEDVVRIAYSEEYHDQIPPQLLNQLATLQIEAWQKLGAIGIAKQWIDRSGIDSTGPAIQVLMQTEPRRALEVIERALAVQTNPSVAIPLVITKHDALMRLNRPVEALDVLAGVRELQRVQIPLELESVRQHVEERVAAGTLDREDGERVVATFEERARQFDMTIGLKEFEARLSQRDMAEAERALIGLEASYPDSLRVKSSRIRFIHALGRTDEAIAKAIALYDTNPSIIPVAIQCAELLWAAERYEETHQLMARLGQEGAGTVAVLVSRGDFYERMGQRSRSETRREECFRMAIRDYTAALNLNDQLVMLRPKIAGLQQAIGEGDAVERELEAMAGAELQTMLLRTRKLLLEGHLAEAEAEGLRALAKDRMFAVTHSLLADVYAAQGKLTEAIESYGRALSYNEQLHDTRFKLAQALLNDQQFQEAAAQLRAIPAGNRIHGAALQLLAGAYRDMGRMDDALATYDELLELVDTPGPVYIVKAQLLAQMALSQGQPRRAEEAEGLLRKAIESAGGDAQLEYNAQFALGRFFFQMGRIDDAHNLFRTMAERHPREPAAFIQLGNINLTQNNVGEADRYYRQAVRIDVNNPMPFVEIGQSYLQLGLPNEALGYAEGALQYTPDSLDALNLKFTTLIQDRQALPQAAETLAAMKAVQPDSPRVTLLDGVLHREQYLAARAQGQSPRPVLETAVNLLVTAQRQMPNQPQAVVELCTAYLIDNNIDACVRTLNDFLRRHPHDRTVRLFSARFNMQRGEHAAAITDLQRLHETHHRDPEVNMLLAQAQLNTHNLQGALSVYQLMAQTYPDQPAWLARIGAVYLRSKDFDNAIRFLQRGWNDSGQRDFDALQGLVECYVQTGRPDGLLAQVDQYLQGHQTVNAKLLRARVLNRMGREQETQEYFDTLAADHPTSSAVWNSYARFFETKANASAEKVRQALRDGQAAQASRHRQERQTFIRATIDVLDRAIKAIEPTGSPEVIQLMSDKARLLVDAGRTDEAFDTFERLLSIARLPENYRTLLSNNYAYYLARYGGERYVPRALELVSTIPNLENQNYGVLDTAGLVYLKSGAPDDALRYLQLALRKNREAHLESAQQNRRDPSVNVVDILPCIHYHLALAYQAKDDLAQAKRHFEEAVQTDRQASHASKLTEEELNDCLSQLRMLQ